LHEQQRQYYDFAKEHLITFGGFDAQTASTGLSQEELLQRTRREETREKKRRNKPSKNRLINFPSGLLKASNQQQNHLSQQNQQQNQSPSSVYHRMGTFASLETSNSRGENVYESSGNNPNPNGNNGRSKGIRESMVSQYLSKNISNNYTELSTVRCRILLCRIVRHELSSNCIFRFIIVRFGESGINPRNHRTIQRTKGGKTVGLMIVKRIIWETITG
jgi:hypothetical protein